MSTSSRAMSRCRGADRPRPRRGRKRERALGELPGVARIETLVGDMGYCAVDALVELQTVGVRTAIPDPVANRRVEKLSPEQRQALRTATRTCRSASGRWLIQHRGEFCERSFVHVLDYGGARRTTLRGREKSSANLVQAACLNLSILLRETLQIGTLKQAWSASATTVAAAKREFRWVCRRDDASVRER